MNKNLLYFIGIAGISYLGFKAWERNRPEPKAVITLGAFSFTVPKNAFIEGIIERLRTQTKPVFTQEGLKIIFPSLPLPVGVGTVEVIPKPKTVPYKQIGTTLSNRQKRVILKEIITQVNNIKMEQVVSDTDTNMVKIIIPQIKIPIYD